MGDFAVLKIFIIFFFYVLNFWDKLGKMILLTKFCQSIGLYFYAYELDKTDKII